MTRVKEAKKACAVTDTWDTCDTRPITPYSVGYTEGYGRGIEAGVRWADSHPRWHKYPAEKPPKQDDYSWSDTVLVVLKGNDCIVKAALYYGPRDGELDKIEKWYSPELKAYLVAGHVIAWIELPQPPKFD